jgi:serine/threonine-protein kinase
VPATRADTIALLDQVDRKREVPTKVAVGIIVALSVVAGIGAYALRSTSAPVDAAPSATAAAPPPPARTR